MSLFINIGPWAFPKLYQIRSERHISASSLCECESDLSSHSAVPRRAILRLFAAVAFTQIPGVNTLARVRIADEGAQDAPPVQLPSGLIYYDFRKGEGDIIRAGDVVAVDYTLGSTGARYGYEIDGSYGGGDPLVFEVGGKSGVITGLDQAVEGMRVGGKRRAIVPKELGFKGTKGERPVPKGFAEYQRFKNLYLNKNRPYVPDVVFDIEVLRIVKK